MAEEPARFKSFTKKAEVLLSSPGRLQKLTGQAVRKLTGRGVEGINQVRSQLQTAVALINAWRLGEYQGVSNKTLVILVAAVLYFVVPFDVIPDFLLGWGLVDDVAVITYVFSQIDDEIEAFKTWQAGNDATVGDETPD